MLEVFKSFSLCSCDPALQISVLVQELYHELNALDRFEQDYRQKVEEVQSLNLSVKGWHGRIFSLHLIFFLMW
jgi:hypothetical protein